MRLTETYHFWTKNNPANVELVPEPYAEINERMAEGLGIAAGDFVRISSARGAHILIGVASCADDGRITAAAGEFEGETAGGGDA